MIGETSALVDAFSAEPFTSYSSALALYCVLENYLNSQFRSYLRSANAVAMLSVRSLCAPRSSSIGEATMKTKLMVLFFVAVLMISSCGAIAAVQTKIVDGATVSSAQTAPHFAQLNPDFVKYQQGLSAGNARTVAQTATGFIPPPIDLTQLKGQSIRSALVGAASPPSSYDLRTQSKLTSVKNQGSCGSCWAFGAYASLESYLRPAETMDFSENNVKNTHGFDMAPCDGGDDVMSTAYLARWGGPVSETADPYNAGSGSSPANLPVQKHVQDVYYIPDRVSSTDNDNIKTAVMAYGALYTTMDFYDSSSYYNPSTHAYYKATTGVNHAVAIVGWNDNYAASNFAGSPTGNGAWIVKNSFGTSWGDNGYFYVSYYDANIGKYNAAFTAQPTTNYNNIYQYDPLGATRQLRRRFDVRMGGQHLHGQILRKSRRSQFLHVESKRTV